MEQKAFFCPYTASQFSYKNSLLPVRDSIFPLRSGWFNCQGLLPVCTNLMRTLSAPKGVTKVAGANA